VATPSMHRALLDEPWFAAGDFHTSTLEGWLK
jgi:acetyl-CoA carboxylase, biotin carboxylase subunit